MKLLIGFGLAAVALAQQPAGFNYEESKVAPYTLPDPLVMKSGERVKALYEQGGKHLEKMRGVIGM